MSYLEQLEVNAQRAQYIALNMHAAGAVARFAIGVGNGRPFVVSCDPDLGLPDLIEELRMAANYLEQSDPADVFVGPDVVRADGKPLDATDGNDSENGNDKSLSAYRMDAINLWCDWRDRVIVDLDKYLTDACITAIEAVLWARAANRPEVPVGVEIRLFRRSCALHNHVLFPPA